MHEVEPPAFRWPPTWRMPAQNPSGPGFPALSLAQSCYGDHGTSKPAVERRGISFGVPVAVTPACPLFSHAPSAALRPAAAPAAPPVSRHSAMLKRGASVEDADPPCRYGSPPGGSRSRSQSRSPGGRRGVAAPLTPDVVRSLMVVRKRRRDIRFVRKYGDTHPEDLPEDIECIRNPFLGTCVYVWAGMQFKLKDDAVAAKRAFDAEVAARRVRWWANVPFSSGRGCRWTAGSFPAEFCPSC